MVFQNDQVSADEGFGVALFESTSAVLAAERILKEGGVSYKIIPVPRHLSSDCGVCVRFSLSDRGRMESLLMGRLEDYQLVDL